ncbi:HD domain-containing protein [Baekduia soli]|uniref:HD domain-containing protein n=1 Tax=Baekduia soli TaxID=496014 RepID=A0A5B8UB33_9ACTN|nr:HD domain-containing phosphohydrolase [Baekduia soli]QEC50255.1 HD domain-containing protein [Baekduia soli]
MARRSVFALQAALFVAAITAAVLTSRASDWHPIGLVVGLLPLMVLSEALAIETKSLRLSGGFIVVVLATALLGPAPALALQMVALTVDAIRRPLPRDLRLANLCSGSVYPIVGALLVRALGLPTANDLDFALGVFAVFFVTNTVNFSTIAIPFSITHGVSLRKQVVTAFLPMLPAEALAGALTVTIAVTYRAVGATALAALFIVLFLFQVLTRELLLSQRRAEELETRSTQLASLQVGVLSAMLQTLSLRDRMTARHSAAVARYARAIAAEIGCSEIEQELVHTAGLLHDIGKFAFPDRILLANRKLDDDDWNIVRTHPYQGARLVRRIDGYGPVAEIILAHHERIDGRGYPRGLVGEEIPIFARMISIADTYDVMTARDSYRTPVPQAEAFAELRRVSGAQLDGDLVEVFIGILGRRDLTFQHTTDADFEHELDFDRRVLGYSLPLAA